MQSVDLNWWAVLVAGILNMVVGAIWYAPAVFGKTWMKELGMKPGAGMSSSMGKAYGITFVGALVMAYVTAMVVGFSGAATIADGLVVGFWLWLGYAVTIPLNDVVFGKKTTTLYMLNVFYYLIVLLLSSAMLATWM